MRNTERTTFLRTIRPDKPVPLDEKTRERLIAERQRRHQMFASLWTKNDPARHARAPLVEVFARLSTA